MAVSNVHIIRTLIAKDWRLFRVPMVALIIVCAGCYLLALISIVDIYQEYWRYPVPYHPGHMAADSLFSAAVGANGLTCLLAAAIGGVAIAGERTERTSDFLALLPVTRMQIILSKLLSGTLMLGVFALFHLIVAAICLPYAETTSPMGRASMLLPSVVWFGCALSLFGVGWLFSTLIPSGPISVCASIAITAAAMTLVTISIEGHPHTDRKIFLHLIGVTFGIGLPTLIAGSLYYLNRIAP